MSVFVERYKLATMPNWIFCGWYLLQFRFDCHAVVDTFTALIKRDSENFFVVVDTTLAMLQNLSLLLTWGELNISVSLQ